MKTSAPRTASLRVPSTDSALVLSAIHCSDGLRFARPAVDDAVDVGDHHVLGAGLDQQPDDRRAGGTRTRHHDPDVVELLVDHAQRVGQRREHDDRGAVLVVVEDRDVEQLAQPRLDLEAARRRDVLEVDAGEHRRDQLHGAHDLVGVLGVQADRPGVDAGEPLEQRGLALHHRQRGLRPDVAEPEHGRAVGDDRDGVALDGEPPGVGLVRRDRQADPRDARRVDHRQVVAVADRVLGRHLDRAAEVHEEGPVGDLVHVDALDAAQLRRRSRRRGRCRGPRR